MIYVNKRVCGEDGIIPLKTYSEENNNSGEFQFIKIIGCKGTNKSHIIGNVYRTPSLNPTSFNNLFDKVLQKLRKQFNKHVTVVGDFNQDLIKHDENLHYQNLIDNTARHGLLQLVSRPTRLTLDSATLIDHVYTNNISSVLSCHVVTLDMSDHLATVTKIDLSPGSFNALKCNLIGKQDVGNSYRVINEANNRKFAELLSEQKWDAVTHDMDAVTKFSTFNDIYNEMYNKAYPLKCNHKKRSNERSDPKPWILPWLENACTRKNNLYHNFIKTPSPQNKAKYLKMKKFCNIHTSKAKAAYHKKYFNDYKDNSKKQWQMINNLLGRTRGELKINKLVDSKGKTINTPNGIAEHFLDYFGNIASNLKKEISARSSKYDNHFFMKDPVNRSLYLRPVDPSEIHQIIKNFKNKSTLDTKISALKIANLSIAFTTVLSKVINSSFEEGIFPDELKIARVIALHKGGKKCEVSNYRPISLLATFSKIYEKLMHSRILSFLESNNSIFDSQYGFRPKRSCEHALLDTSNYLLDKLSQKQVNLLLMIDFSKAFDMVDHDILISKLSHYGIRGIALDWMKSYLTNRKQFVSVNGVDSSHNIIKYGVPQGSILGPLLFVIYINDIPSICLLSKFILYADDANIIISAPTIEEVHIRTQKLIDNLIKWVDSNGLALNIEKTKFMIFSRSETTLNKPLLLLGKRILQIKEAKFLGVIIDEKLTWTKHVKTVKSKMSRYIGVLCKIKSYLPLSSRIQIYHSLIQSHVNYCCLVWGFSSRSNIESIFSVQKKGIRAIVPGFINYFYKLGVKPGNTKPYFREYGILTIHSIIALNSLLLVEKSRKFSSLLPSQVALSISNNSPTLSSTLESSEEWLNKYNTQIYRTSVFFKGPMLSTRQEFNICFNEGNNYTITSYKNKMKSIITSLQTSGSDTDWDPQNFLTFCVPGLRKSTRNKLIEH